MARQTCPNGHTYIKTSSCPTCPVCENKKETGAGLLSLLSAPARRALQSQGISTAKKLSKFTEKEILALHGIGPSSMPILRKALRDEGLAFRG
jgi:hypothetical protein